MMRSPLLLFALVLAACAEDGAQDAPDAAPNPGPSSADATDAIEADLRDLVNAVTPLPATAPVGERNAWFGRRRATLERLQDATRAHGLEALRWYRERPDAVPQVRSGLLAVAAYNAPEETLPVLEELVTTFGDDLGVRTQAAQLMPVASPQATVELFEPILLGRVGGMTFPPEERLLEAWDQAMQTLERDRVPVLCAVATDLPREMSVRHLAIRLLGELPSEQGRQALEHLMVESSGNHMLRRLAAQSLRATVDVERLCPYLVRVRDNEADQAFQMFLDDMIRKACP